MFKRGIVYIIPDENKIIEECYSESIQSSHLPAIQNFCDKYKLGYHFRKEQYQDAPYFMAIDGHFVIKTLEDESVVFFYIPKFVTERQLMWFYHNKYKFEKYGLVSACTVSGDKDNVQIEEFNGLDNVWKTLNYNYKSNGHTHI